MLYSEATANEIKQNEDRQQEKIDKKDKQAQQVLEELPLFLLLRQLQYCPMNKKNSQQST